MSCYPIRLSLSTGLIFYHFLLLLQKFSSEGKEMEKYMATHFEFYKLSIPKLWLLPKNHLHGTSFFMLVYELKLRIEKCKAYSNARLVEHDTTLVLSFFVSIKTDCSDNISSTSFLIDSHLIISKIPLF